MSGELSLIIAGIPAYNEERTIAKVILLTKRYVDKIILCDDGSTDLTAEIARNLGVEVIIHEKTMGKGYALRTIFSRAFELNPDIVVVLDSDGQHDPTQIPILVKPIIEKNADMVVGSRYTEGAATDIPRYRRIGLGVINWLSRRRSNSHIQDTQSGFRAFSLKALKTVSCHESNGYGVEGEQLAIAARNGLKIVEVPIFVKYKGLDKTSKKRPERQSIEIIGAILKLVVEGRPLVFLGIPGIVCLLIGGVFVFLTWQYYTLNRQWFSSWALGAATFVLLGAFTLFTAITLYAIVRLEEKRVYNQRAAKC
jgi:glycosyltransferase involved in cell wall biosynthesis